MILDLYLITLIVVFIIDYSGFIDSLKFAISSLLTKGKIKTTEFRIKPFDCSLCMTFWVGLIYLLITGQFTLFGITIVCIFSALTDTLYNIILLIKDVITYIINKISDKIC